MRLVRHVGDMPFDHLAEGSHHLLLGTAPQPEEQEWILIELLGKQVMD